MFVLGAGPVWGEAMLQHFNTSWGEITRKVPELSEAGYTLPLVAATPSRHLPSRLIEACFAAV